MGFSTTNADGGQWDYYVSDTGIFEVQTPMEFETETINFRLDNERVVHSSTAISMADQRRFKNAFKSHLIQFDQTIGPALTDDQIEIFLSYDVKNYTKRYDGMNAVLKKKELKFIRGFPGAELHISYEDPEIGVQNVRARIIYTDVTRLEQSLTGNQYIMYDYKADKFFETLDVEEGLHYSVGKIDEGWGHYTSPLGIFSVSIPRATPPYVAKDPKITHSEKKELISQTIHDPIWGHNIFYRVYGYQFDQPLTAASVQNILTKNHISKYKKGKSSISYEKTSTDTHHIVETQMSIQAPQKAPYASYAHLRVFFIDNYMIVQEVISSKELVKSALANSLMSFVEFHPDKAAKKLQPPENEKPEKEAKATEN